jgi:hypothetical protein
MDLCDAFGSTAKQVLNKAFVVRPFSPLPVVEIYTDEN